LTLDRKFGVVQEGLFRVDVLRDARQLDTLAMARLHTHPPTAGL
jgi:hypothetical protein